MARRRRKSKFSSWHAPDIPLIVALVILLGFGVLMVYDSSVVSATDAFGGQYHFLLLQLTWVLLGLLALGVFFFLDYHKLRALALPLFVATAALLVIALLPTPISVSVRGAKSWLSLPFNLPILGDITLQPSELSKLALILYLASLFSKDKGRAKKKETPSFVSFAVPTGLFLALILLEPDFGTASIVGGLGFVTYFFAGGSLLALLLAVPAALLGGVVFVMNDPSRWDRVKSFLDPTSDPLGVGYQVRQVLIALGSGGLWGLGIGESRQKYGYIPDISTDAVFAVVGEELGFIGAFFVVFLFAFVIYKGFWIAQSAPDKFGKILAASISSWVGLQVLMNLGSMTGLLPLTGVPLPLISYGGSSLVVLLSSFGILLNISRQTERKRR